MNIQNKEFTSKAIKFYIKEDGKEVGRASLFIITNDLHPEPYGLLEDVYVEKEYRSKGYGGMLVKNVIEEAKKRGCYKLICQARHDRASVHGWYKKLGFYDRGLTFRMDLLKLPSRQPE